MSTQSDMDVLLDMGFDRERAEVAVKKSGGCTCSPAPWESSRAESDSILVQGALEWLEQTQDKPLDELKEEESKGSTNIEAGAGGEVAQSLTCKECGKKFRDQSAAEFHASKSGHVDFEESTEEIAPLTEEEKKQKLAELRERLAEKRSGQAEQDKAERKRNEVGPPPNSAAPGANRVNRRSRRRTPRRRKTPRKT